MLRYRDKRRAAESARATASLATIEASVVALNDEDLLDFADIFAPGPPSPLKAMATAELAKRKLNP